MSYRINGNTVISPGDGSLASANASFRNFFYRYGLNPATYPGTVGGSYGYIAGGCTNLNQGTIPSSPGGAPNVNTHYPLYNVSPGFFINAVERFPFATYVNSVQVSGGLSTTRTAFASQSSKTAGYNSGGFLANPPAIPLTPNATFQTFTASTVVDSFPFVSIGIITVSSAGNLSTARFGCTGQQSDTSGFTSGGSSSNTNPVGLAGIESFPFSSFTTASSVGNLSANNVSMAGHSSPTSGYTSGGFSPIAYGVLPTGSLGTALTTINRFPFSVSPVTASSVATLTTARGYVAGGSSTTNGYTFGGLASSPGKGVDAAGFALTGVERFNFSEQTVTVSAVPITLSQSRASHSVCSSADYGYVCGGYNRDPQYSSVPAPTTATISPYPAGAIQSIDNFPFASTTTTGGTRNMATGRGHVGGNQY